MIGYNLSDPKHPRSIALDNGAVWHGGVQLSGFGFTAAIAEFAAMLPDGEHTVAIVAPQNLRGLGLPVIRLARVTCGKPHIEPIASL
jgi:hypothetical protein